jgi:hypothetical protein
VTRKLKSLELIERAIKFTAQMGFVSQNAIEVSFGGSKRGTRRVRNVFLPLLIDENEKTIPFGSK